MASRTKPKQRLTDDQARALAIEVYESDYREILFNEAYELYPRYNRGGEDTDMAADHIVDGLLRAKGIDDTQFSAAAWDAFINELSEAVYAGLT